MPTIANLDAMAHVVLAGFLGDSAVFADADGLVKLVGEKGNSTQVHDGILAASISLDKKQLITGGEDGRIVATHQNGETTLLGEYAGKWIDTVACGPQGVVGWSSGRKAWARLADGSIKEFECERSIEGLAFAPKGMRLAASRYNGVDLFWVNSAAPPVFLEWKGAHLDVSFSPDGKYVVTTMQENQLHGWRISDARHMRMAGYPAKVKSMSWSPKGKWLATSGAPAAIVWPFSGKDGPMGKKPMELGSMGTSQVTQVACNPQEEIVAIGFSDGMILAVRFEDGKIVPLRRAGEGAISTMGWDQNGSRLAFGSQMGDAGIVNLVE